MMGMTITIEISDTSFNPEIFKKAFDYFEYVENKFSVYKDDSEISLINLGKIKESEYSDDMKVIFKLAEETKEITKGYFDIKNKNGKIDPSGIVKGWAIQSVAEILKNEGIKNFYVNAGGDIQTLGRNGEGKCWSVGIRNPFNPENEIVKVVYIENKGMATSGTYIRGQHIYNPHKKDDLLDEIKSLTVIGPNIYEADRFATPAFAMGKEGINFIESLDGFDAYMIDKNGVGTMTSNFNLYTKEYA